jgi:CHAT domain-containing protein
LIPGPRFPSVPFAALTVGSGYLVERHAVVVSPSAAVYAQLASRKDRRSPRRAVLVVANPATRNADPLTGAETEANHVAQLYSNSRRLTRAEATVDAYRRYAPSADIIHMATHGALGALLLTDGRLDSQTIASIALPRTSAVVLAACDSARGPARAEGTISAARGFLAAGVPAVVATLWKIDDRTAARFFPRVHRDLARGVHAAAAVREAQIEAIEKGQSTALWAAVQCIGTDGG